MFEDNDEDDQTKEPRTRGNRPTDRTATAAAGGAPAATPQAQRLQMPWDRGGQGGGWGQQPAAPNGNTGVVGPGQGGQPQQGGHPGFGWGGGQQDGGQGRGWGHHQMPDWQALAQQFAQRFQGNPMFQRLGMTGQGFAPPGQAPAAPPQSQPAAPPMAQGAPGAQPGAAPMQGQGGPLQERLGRLAQMFGRQQPGGIVGPGQGPQQY